MVELTYSNPVWWCTFYSFGATLKETFVTEAAAGKGGGDCVSFDWNKSIAGGGSFSLRVLPSTRYDLRERVRRNAVVVAWIDAGDVHGPSLFVGIVSRVSLDERAEQDGRVMLAYTVTGRDFEKLLTHSELFFNPQLISSATTLVRNAVLSESFITQTNEIDRLKSRSFFLPYEFAYIFLETYLSASASVWLSPIPSRLQGTNPPRLMRLIDFRAFVANESSFPLARLTPATRLQSYSTLKDLLTPFSHPLLNEMYIDTRPDSEEAKDAMPESVFQDFRLGKRDTTPIEQMNASNNWSLRFVLRPRPYSLALFRRLPVYRIPKSHLSSLSTGFDDENIKNYFRYVAAPLDQTFDVLRSSGGKEVVAYIVPESIQRDGIRRMEGVTDFCLPRASALQPTTPANKKGWSADVLAGATVVTEALATQYATVAHQDNGQATTSHVKPWMRVGNAVEIYEQSYEDAASRYYYLESVSHSTSVDAPSSSTLTLVRGVTESVYKSAVTDTQAFGTGLVWLTSNNALYDKRK